MLRKTCNDGDDRTDSGKLFQTDATVGGKVRSPMVERTVRGATSADELDLFSVPPTQISMKHVKWVEYYSVTTVSEGLRIEFDISGTENDYIDFANTILHVKAEITQNNGTNLPADVAIGRANLFLHSLFSQVDISLNGTLITASTNTYPCRAMLETLLSYGQDAKTSQLTSALHYKDTAGHMDNVTLDANVAVICGDLWCLDCKVYIHIYTHVISIMSSHPHASTSDSIINYWRYINISLID